MNASSPRCPFARLHLLHAPRQVQPSFSPAPAARNDVICLPAGFAAVAARVALQGSSPIGEVSLQPVPDDRVQAFQRPPRQPLLVPFHPAPPNSFPGRSHGFIPAASGLFTGAAAAAGVPTVDPVCAGQPPDGCADCCTTSVDPRPPGGTERVKPGDVTEAGRSSRRLPGRYALAGQDVTSFSPGPVRLYSLCASRLRVTVVVDAGRCLDWRWLLRCRSDWGPPSPLGWTCRLPMRSRVPWLPSR